MAEKLLFKKYANRRIYDTENSRYVTLNQVAEVIKQGRQIEVIDAKTKENVTAFILTQVILEEAKRKNFLLPAPLLHLIIQYGDNILAEFFEKYLQQTIQNYLSHKAAVDDQFKQWLEMGLNFTQKAQKTMVDLSPFKSFLDPFNSSSNDSEEK